MTSSQDPSQGDAQVVVHGPQSMGRMARGFHLIRESWDFLSARPQLLVLPGLAALASLLAMLTIELPILYATRDHSLRVALGLAGVAAAFPLAFITVFFNVGFLMMVEAHLRGEAPSAAYGLRAARSRTSQILGWALLSASVGALLTALEHLPVVGGLAGRISAGVAGLAWSLATFFVVPVLAFEGLGPVATARRSASIFRRRWGEAVTGDIAIGTIMVFLIVPGILAVVVAAIAFEEHAYAAGFGVGAIGIALLAPATAVTSALTCLFQFFLYREANGAPVAGPFTDAELSAGLKPKKRRRFFP